MIKELNSFVLTTFYVFELHNVTFWKLTKMYAVLILINLKSFIKICVQKETLKIDKSKR